MLFFILGVIAYVLYLFSSPWWFIVAAVAFFSLFIGEEDDEILDDPYFNPWHLEYPLHNPEEFE